MAQKYIDLCKCSAFYEALAKADPTFPLECIRDEKGCNNKMFVKSAWMPHRIKITNIKIERLQDISDEDCLREGVLHSDKYAMPYGITEVTAPNGVFFYYSFPREAFAGLIDKVSGKGTWDRNPWVFAYEFELVK